MVGRSTFALARLAEVEGELFRLDIDPFFLDQLERLRRFQVQLSPMAPKQPLVEHLLHQ